MTETATQAMQERMAYLERTLSDLSDVIARQDREIQTLTRRVAMLMQREAERESDLGGIVPLADQKPPHW
ncbi:SlyX family protein [Meridianimarinicoccus sp. MJW13]|uniref:SlyX family protein n=1 Tax=Meridianimarinicoccus sp. MJW13 TaxID=2720031 RepID=UPI001869084E|nr:SlyX family protein [Fluviibacterium sp. MJW13]